MRNPLVCVRVLLSIGLLLVVVPSAFALSQDSGPMDTMCGSIDDCFHSGDWWMTKYDSYGSVTTCGLWGCQTCVDNGYGKLICAYHTPVSDGCKCVNKQAGATRAITNCVLSGICTVTNNP
jgi:hypothetical protein